MHPVRVYTTYYTHTHAYDIKPKTRTSDHPLTRAHTYIKQGCWAHGAVESRADSVATAVVSVRPADDEPGRILMKTSFYGKYEIDHYVMLDMCASVCVRARKNMHALYARAIIARLISGALLSARVQRLGFVCMCGVLVSVEVFVLWTISAGWMYEEIRYLRWDLWSSFVKLCSLYRLFTVIGW